MSELTKIMTKAKTSGSLRFTMKKSDCSTKQSKKKDKITKDSSNAPSLPISSSTLESQNKSQVLIRVTLGRGKKISTNISHKDVTKFQQTFYNLLKTNMDALRKTRPKISKKNKKPTN
ncbi:unnamed protein product [Gordionus sp. m RMFG-2023]